MKIHMIFMAGHNEDDLRVRDCPWRWYGSFSRCKTPVARFVAVVHKYNLISEVLAHLYWFPVCFCAKSEVLVLTHKAVSGLGTHNLTEHLSLRLSTHATQSSQVLHLCAATPSSWKTGLDAGPQHLPGAAASKGIRAMRSSLQSKIDKRHFFHLVHSYFLAFVLYVSLLYCLLFIHSTFSG